MDRNLSPPPPSYQKAYTPRRGVSTARPARSPNSPTTGANLRSAIESVEGSRSSSSPVAVAVTPLARVRLQGVTREIIPIMFQGDRYFVAPDFLQADYQKILGNRITRNPKKNYELLLEMIVRATKGEHTWGQQFGYQSRLTSAEKKLQDLSPLIYSILQSTRVIFDYGSGDGTMGYVMSQILQAELILGDLKNTVFEVITNGRRFLPISFDGDCDLEPQSVDLITAFHSLHHFYDVNPLEGIPPNYGAVMRRVIKMRELLRPNSYLLVREHDVGFTPALVDVGRGEGGRGEGGRGEGGRGEGGRGEGGRGEGGRGEGGRGEGVADDPAKIANVCLTHIAYEMNEPETAWIKSLQQAKRWLETYRLALTSVENMCGLIIACGFELIAVTQPTGKDYSYYALFRRVDGYSGS